MMMLLQWPWFSRSPSRNQTPGAICFTVLGWASPRVRGNPNASKAIKAVARDTRKCFMLVDCIAGRLGLRAAGFLLLPPYPIRPLSLSVISARFARSDVEIYSDYLLFDGSLGCSF